jgi:hypothetical protein
MHERRPEPRAARTCGKLVRRVGVLSWSLASGRRTARGSRLSHEKDDVAALGRPGCPRVAFRVSRSTVISARAICCIWCDALAQPPSFQISWTLVESAPRATRVLDRISRVRSSIPLPAVASAPARFGASTSLVRARCIEASLCFARADRLHGMDTFRSRQTARRVSAERQEIPTISARSRQARSCGDTARSERCEVRW